MTRSTAPALAVGTGAQIAQVQPGTPADRAGLRSGDVVTAIGNRPITSSAELAAAVRSTEPGGELTLTIQRADQTTEVEVRLSGASV